MRFLPVLAVAIVALATLLIVNTLIADVGVMRETFLGEDNTPLLVYGLLAITAAVGAIIFRSWWAVAAIPLAMLATWVLSERMTCPGCWQPYAYTYRLPLSSESLTAEEAQIALRALQLVPALVGAVIGSTVTAVWGWGSDTEGDLRSPSAA